MSPVAFRHACRNAKTAIAFALLATVLPLSSAHAEPHDDPGGLEAAGDALQFGVPLLALGLTFLFEAETPAEGGEATWGPQRFGIDSDWMRMNGSPRHDLALALGRTELATYSLKYGIDEQRPNGHGESFPSGHTSIAFAGAEFIRKQYGWGWGVGGDLSASVVGWSRVAAGKHWTHDVLAGAAIGVLSNHDDLGFAVSLGRGRELTVTPALLAPGLGAPLRADVLRESIDEPPLGIGAGFRLEARF